jgi:hypothetical protein
VDLLACTVERTDRSATYSRSGVAADPLDVVTVTSYALVLWMVNARTGALEGGPWLEPAPLLPTSTKCPHGCSIGPDSSIVMWDIAKFMQLPEPFRTFIP